MNASQSNVVRFVTLTLLWSAAIVPALLARRVLDAKAVLADAEKYRVDVMKPGSVDPGAAVVSITNPASQPGISNIEMRQIERAIAVDRTAAPSNSQHSRAVRFFSNTEIDPTITKTTTTKTTTTKATIHNSAKANETGAESKPAGSQPADGDNTLLPPAACETSFSDEGVTVSWKDNPFVSKGLVVKTQLYRWNESETPAPVFVTQPYIVTDSPKPHSFLDRNTCDGMQYTYGVLVIQYDKLEGVEVRQSALGGKTVANVPVRYQVDVVGFVVSEAHVTKGQATNRSPEPSTASLAIRILDLRDAEPKPKEVVIKNVAVGNLSQSVGFEAELGFDPGWQIKRVDREYRDETAAVSVPVFQPDGSRKVENGVAVQVIRNEMQKNAYPVVWLKNKCGREQVIRVAAKKEAGAIK
ncbi:MAG: hypothetical protein ACKVS6_13275 [Planctomycetota bacterium]